MMAVSFLKFDSKKLAKDFYRMLSHLSAQLITDFYNEATSGLKNKNHTELEMPFSEQKYIRSRVYFYANAIMESYGVGSLMDKNSPYLDEYMQSDQWNKLRGTATTIVGRGEGDYQNILGQTATSKGTMAGSSVENIVKPRPPTYQIQNAERWFLRRNDKIQRQLEISISVFFSGKEMKKYFKNVR